MSEWCDFLCDFPDDDNATLDAVLAAMPDDRRAGLTHSPVPLFRLSLASEGAAISLVLGVDGVFQAEGFTTDVEVLVPWSSRPECEQQITDLNHGPAHWTRLERFEASGVAWQAFHQHWLVLAAT